MRKEVWCPKRTAEWLAADVQLLKCKGRHSLARQAALGSSTQSPRPT